MRDPLHWSAEVPDRYTHQDGYVIVAAMVGDAGRQSPVHWCYHHRAFIGAAGGTLDAACALCADHAEGKLK